ncbi:hypothetical protein QN277_007032 [Acacia crassicarpa]|uniref:Uncharacterized protein n=1 Tax=Acacia crassicarpa TaxID=499986 RepID=A0AAE1ITX0_9FABA|nr:hypothetical protein QN277_007032 [Acacia crassicarpa]
MRCQATPLTHSVGKIVNTTIILPRGHANLCPGARYVTLTTAFTPSDKASLPAEAFPTPSPSSPSLPHLSLRLSSANASR